MQMDNQDIQYLDGKFARVHERIDAVDSKVDEVKTTLAVSINETAHIKTNLDCHIKKPCIKVENNMNNHLQAKHDLSWGRILKTVAIILGIIISVITVVSLLI